MTGTATKASPLLIQEVATRDGFQIEPVFVATADKIALIARTIMMTTGTGQWRIEPAPASAADGSGGGGAREAERGRRLVDRAIGLGSAAVLGHPTAVPQPRGAVVALARVDLHVRGLNTRPVGTLG